MEDIIRRIIQLEMSRGKNCIRMMEANGISQEQFEKIFKLMQKYERIIATGNGVNRLQFQREVESIVPEKGNNPVLCEEIVAALFKDGYFDQAIRSLYEEWAPYFSYLHDLFEI